MSEPRSSRPAGDASPDGSTSRDDETYVPGFAKTKTLVVLIGLAILGFGGVELAGPMGLLLAGSKTTAEVTKVIKTKAGLPDQVLTTELQLRNAEETVDRSYVFWNEFHFTSRDGADHIVRFSIGSQLKPIFPLQDSEGLPTEVSLYYDPKKPDRICVPSVLSTWFAPGLLTLAGLFCFVCSGLILRGANKPLRVS